MGQPRILILCGGKFAFPAIQILALEKYLCGIGIGKADKEVVRFLERETSGNGIPFNVFPDRDSVKGLAAWIEEVQPDHIFSICFPFLVPEEALAFGRERFFNFHTGPLPGYRGPMPLFEVLRYEEKETAVTVHRMTNDFDDGAIVLSEYIPITDGETFGSLAVKLSGHTSLIAHNMAQMLEFATVIPTIEQDESQARYFEFPEPSDTLIQWNRMPASEIVALVNACNPWNNGADALLKGKNVRILQGFVITEPHTVQPGQIIGIDERLVLRIACIDNEQIGVELISNDAGIMTAQRYAALEKITSVNEFELK